jgi:hypothetical protein
MTLNVHAIGICSVREGCWSLPIYFHAHLGSEPASDLRLLFLKMGVARFERGVTIC